MTYAPTVLPEAKSEVGKCVSRYETNVGSAASLTLVTQALLPCLVLCGKNNGTVPIEVTLVGGTNVSFSPPVEHLFFVLLPLLSQIGLNTSAKLQKRGFYPRGGGMMSLKCNSIPLRELRPFNLVTQGIFQSAHIYVYDSSEDSSALEGTEAQYVLLEARNNLNSGLRTAVTELLSKVENSAENILFQFENLDSAVEMGSITPLPPSSITNDNCKIYSSAEDGDNMNKMKRNMKCGGNEGGSFSKQQKKHHANKKGKVAVTLGALVSLRTSSGCIISADYMVNEKNHKQFDASKSAIAVDEIISTVMSRLERTVCSGACVDEQTADQLLIYMGLAGEASEILCAPFCESDHSQHINAAIEVISQFTGRQFNVEVNPDTKCRLIRCHSASKV